MTLPLKQLFLLDPQVVFLNHGSFGACPRPVFEVYQNWQRELERQPVEFLGRQFSALMAEARSRLAAYLGVAAEDVVYFPNPSTAINMAARNIPLQPEDEILTTDHEYGAMDRTWRYICRRTGARYVRRPIPLPVATPEAFIETLWGGVNERTRVIFLSHVTSPTALTFPLAEICRRARQAGILSIVDGAHAPGQIRLNLAEIGADLYTGALHKWLCAPKGAAFLYAHREIQHWLDPLVISWGYESEHPGASQFIDYHELQGTRDISAFLSVPAAIDFQEQHDWISVQESCHALAVETRQQINTLTDLPPICPQESVEQPYRWFSQMFAARLPDDVNLETLKQRLYEEYRIEVPFSLWNGQKLIRLSFQGYNNREDADLLLKALAKLLSNILR